MLYFLKGIYNDFKYAGKGRTIANLIFFFILQVGVSINRVIINSDLSVVDKKFILFKTLYYLLNSVGLFLFLVVIGYYLFVFFVDAEATYSDVVNRLLFLCIPNIFDFISCVIWLIVLKDNAFTIVHFGNFINFTGSELTKYSWVIMSSNIIFIAKFIFSIILCVFLFKRNQI